MSATGWKRHRLITQAAGNTLAAVDAFAAPVVPNVDPLLVPLYRADDTHFDTKSIECVVELFAADGTPVGPGTLALDIQLFEVDYSAERERSVLIGYDATGSSGIAPWVPVGFDSAPGPRRCIIGIVGQAGAAAANFTDIEIRWRELS